MEIQSQTSFDISKARRHYLLHTDGACRGNPGPGGWGAVLQLKVGSEVIRRGEHSGFDPDTTNNRMEIAGALHMLPRLKEPGVPVIIVADSEWLVRGATEWLPAWKARGWRKSDGKSVKNLEQWKTLDGLMGVRPTHWEWTRGHAGHELNERCDVLANTAIAKGLQRRSAR